ncbi:MAG: glycosyltransferase family 4 protein [Candidatus Aminicenantes bacterium]|nr:glycosyltransferase family 4 protein [Acidobacteriota bacterium]MCG2811118.1 glycosyltransferase family 4 protein [Candidatus Aminicenantes bacterium]
MRVFIDGLIFGRQRHGGLSRMWAECLDRLPGLGVDLQLLIPWRADNDSLRRLLAERGKFAHSQRDFFFWPRRIFERTEIRSRILERIYLGKGTQIFHSTYYSTVNRAGVRKVVTVPDMILELFADEFPSRWTRLGIRTKRQALINADAVVTISEVSKQDILKMYPSIPEKRIKVIPLGVTQAQPGREADFSQLAARYRLPVKSGNYFLFVGLRRGYKNFDLLARLASLPDAREALFVCVGGEDPGTDRQSLAARGLGSRFTFIGDVSDDKLRTLYQHARALIFPSLYEGFGLPLLEAMAHDCPVLCSDIAVFREVAADAAVYFDPHDPHSLSAAMTALHHSKRQELLRRGRHNCGRFSWDITAAKLVGFYRDLV